jgi:acetolactate synthase-1/2/3 large subunit
MVAKAFYIASTGRPGPVLLDITKDAQFGKLNFAYEKCTRIRSYVPEFPTDKKHVKKAAELINSAKKPYIIYGQGILLSGAEKELLNFIEKTGIPAASTLLGISALPSDHPLNMGMLGMHGNYAPNIKTNECDVLIAIGMRFDDRVTGNIHTYAKQAKVIHIEIDPAEVDKNIKTEVAIVGDAKHTLRLLSKLVEAKQHPEWVNEFLQARKKEEEKVIINDLHPTKPGLTMGEVVRLSTNLTDNKAVIVTDVGQNQMAAARYARFNQSRSWVTSGGLGTMGFGLPASIGAKFGAPEKEVILFAGDGGIQMTMQELGTIAQEKLPVKIVILNNDFLGMVRQWQELFFEKRYSFTEITSPDFVKLAAAYGIPGATVSERSELEPAMKTMIDAKGPYLLEVKIEQEDNIFPMVPAGATVSRCLLGSDEL